MAFHFADFNDQYIFRLGYALLHFLWQGAIVALIAAVVLRIMRPTTADRRYVVLLSSLLVMAVCPVATLCLINGPSSQEASHAVAAAAFGAVEIVESEHVPSAILPEIQQIPSTGMSAFVVKEPAEDSASTPRSLRPYLIPMVAIWCVGVCLLSLRLIVGWANTFRVRWMGLSDVSLSIQSMCEKLSATMAVRSTVRVCESTLVQVPVVVGCLRPLILLPACLVSGLSEQQLRAILAHELAHVRRHDYLVNFAQILIENLLFYHPAIWWLSNRIRQERENCCDDIAAAVGGGNRVLARALATLAELHVTAPQTLPAATGGSLVNRIRRLTGTEARPDKLVSGGLGVGILVGLFFFLAMAMLFHSPSGSADESRPTSSQLHTSVEANTQEPDSATPAAEEPKLEQTTSAEPSSDVTFDDLYRIPEGRVLHRVPLPLTPGARKRYEAAVGPQQVAAMPDGPSGVIWKFDGKETKIHKAAFGGGDGQSLFTLVELLADVEMCELEGTASLWLTKISADFVLRSGAQQDEIISDLQSILKDELNLNVSLKFEDVEREVLVASGNFVGKPEGPSLQYQAKPRSTYLLYGETQSEHPQHDMGKYPDFWKAVSLRVGRRVVDESKNAPEDYLQWLLSYDHPETTIWDTIPPRQFSANADVALDRLSEQTGLRFEAGRRRIRVLTLQANPVAKAGALNSSGSLAQRSQAASSNDRRSLETTDSDEASARPEGFPLEAWNRLPEEFRRRLAEKELRNRRAAEDQAEHIQLSRGWKLTFPANVQENELAGVIVDTEGRPLAGALVDCHTAFTGDETTTDERGMFRYKFDIEGRGNTIEVRFSKEGFSPVYRREQPLGVADLRVVLNNKTHLEGQVTDEAGNPVPHAEVIAGHPYIWSGEYPSFNRETTTLTDDRGRYRLYLWPEVYSVSVFTRSAGVARMQNVKVQKNQGQTLDVSLQPGVMFKAKVVDAETKAPVAGLTLYHRTRPELHGISDAEGVIEISGALPGNEEFQIGSGIPELTRGYYKCPTEPFGSWWSPDAVKPWHRKSTTEVAIMFDLSRDMTPVGLTVQAGVVISGKVTDPNGNPVADATVAPARTGTGNSLTGDTRYSVKTQTDGTYVISLPPSGNDEYNLIAHDGAYSEWRNFAGSASEPMHTKPGQRIEGIDMQLHRPATVRGKVSVPDGQRVKGLTVRAHAHDKRGNRYYDPTTRTDQNGEFEIGFIRPGEHYIQVEPFQMNAEDAPSESSVIVEVSEGETKDGIELHAR